LEEWNDDISEKSYSALVLSLFMSDDVSTDLVMDVPWAFKYPSLMTQPTILALGFRKHLSSQSRIKLSHDVNYYEHGGSNSKLILEALGGKKLNSFIHNNNEIKTCSNIIHDINGNSVSSSINENKVNFETSKFLFDQNLEGESLLVDVYNDDGDDEIIYDDDNNNNNNNNNNKNNDEFVNINDKEIPTKILRFEVSELGQDDIYDGIPTTDPDKNWFDIFVNIGNEDLINHFHHLSKLDLNPLVNEGLSIKYIEYLANIETNPVIFDHAKVAEDLIIKMKENEDNLIKKILNLDINVNYDDNSECMAAASYYFPITQYVTSHASDLNINSPQIYLQDLRIKELAKEARFGSGDEDEIINLNEIEAYNGHPGAQTWMGIRNFYGDERMPANINEARRWFELAANQNHPEAEYNLGVFHANGNAGFVQDQEVAMEYFIRAASSENPSPHALDVLGRHYHSDSKHKNDTLSRQFFKKSAEVGSALGHFNYAAFLKDGIGGEKNFVLCIYHLSAAITLGNTDAMNFLAHALYDPESWLSYEIRQIDNKKLKNDIINGINENNTLLNNTSDVTSETDSSSYNSSLPIKFTLHNQVIELPYPLQTGKASCPAALALMRHVSQDTFHTNNIMSTALEAYKSGDIWTSLEKYEEASDLGIASAQENSIFIIEDLIATNFECFQISNESNINNNEIIGNDVLNITDEYNSYCSSYFNRMMKKRWIQLVNSGINKAQKKVAIKLQNKEAPFIEGNDTESFLLFGSSANQGDVESLMSLGWMLQAGVGVGINNEIQSNHTAAKHAFQTSITWDLESNNNEGGTSYGIAPTLALGLLKLDEYLINSNIINISILTNILEFSDSMKLKIKLMNEFIRSYFPSIYFFSDYFGLNYEKYNDITNKKNRMNSSIKRINQNGFEKNSIIILFLVIIQLLIIYLVINRRNQRRQ
jgi:TPR repeat protein